MTSEAGRPDVAAAGRILAEACGERLRRDFPLASLTTFRIGGPAALFLEPRSMVDLSAVSRARRETGIAVTVLGKGSNVLVSDAGVDGLVIRLGRGFRWSARDGERLTAGAAMPLPGLAGVAMHAGLSGLEFGIAIPGSVGGAVRMNAGAHEGSMAQVVTSVECFDLERGEAAGIQAADAGFAYRTSSLPGLVIAVEVALTPDDAASIRGRMDEARRWRRETQPLSEPNCGSVFRNPPGDHAARLIEEVGAKGLAVGGASVSTKHANFITAAPGTKAEDVLALVTLVQERVRERFGVDLHREVHLVGEFEGVAR